MQCSCQKSIGSLILFPIVKRKVSEIYGIADPAAVDEQSEEVQQISKQLLDHAVRMFLDYLRKTRHSRRKNSSGTQNSSVGKDTAKEKFIDQVGLALSASLKRDLILIIGHRYLSVQNTCRTGRGGRAVEHSRWPSGLHH